MLTQYGIQAQLDAIANEVSQMPGLYYELYSRMFSERVHQWMRSTSPTQAELILRVASEDPDFLQDLEIPVHAYARAPKGGRALTRPAAMFNPAWDVEY
jgi:hypothetical protein